MRSLMLCLVVLPFVISCTGSSETNKAGISSKSQSTSQDISPDNGMETITNSIGMKLVLIPKGTFQMGSRLTPEEVDERYPQGSWVFYTDESQHRVKLTKSFYLGVHEVTVGQFRKFVEAEGYKTDAERDAKGGFGYDAERRVWDGGAKYSWRNPGFEQDDKHPVVNVSWNDSVAFCKWLSRVEGREYRLPTEAEWEYSCRAGSSTEFTFGDDAELLVGFGNLGDGSLRDELPMMFPMGPSLASLDGSIFTSRVGSYWSNAFGLHDMHGNVSEWCSDWYWSYWRWESWFPRMDPGPATGSSRVSRGGGWIDRAADCRSARRKGAYPSFRIHYLGFRVALSSSFTGSSETNKAGISSESQSTSQDISPDNELETITNSIGMKLVLIPKGTFMMGSPEREDEPQHQVTISKDYYLGVTEVTQGQYEKVINPSRFQKSRVRESDTSMYPVEEVWVDAEEFCKKLSDLPEEKKAGRVYRLPTEAEWEYACRAGSKSAYSFGESSKSLGDYAWFEGNSNGQTHPVGEKKANAWGLYDMHGNVWEWCSDEYGVYPEGAVSDPVGPREVSFRVLSGGCWGIGAAYCRSAVRFRRPTYWGHYYGFRLALSPSGIPQSPEADK